MPEGVEDKPLALVKTSVESRAGYGLMVVRESKMQVERIPGVARSLFAFP